MLSVKSFAFVSLLSASIPSILAADCFNGQGRDPNVDVAWTLRDQICGQGACGFSDQALGSNQYCTLFKPIPGGGYVQMQRFDPSGQFSHW